MLLAESAQSQRECMRSELCLIAGRCRDALWNQLFNSISRWMDDRIRHNNRVGVTK